MVCILCCSFINRITAGIKRLHPGVRALLTAYYQLREKGLSWSHSPANVQILLYGSPTQSEKACTLTETVPLDAKMVEKKERHQLSDIISYYYYINTRASMGKYVYIFLKSSMGFPPG